MEKLAFEVKRRPTKYQTLYQVLSIKKCKNNSFNHYFFLSSFQFRVAEISPRQNGFRHSCIQVFEHCQAPVFLQLSAGEWAGTHQGLPDLQLPDYLVSFLCFPLNQGQQPRCLNPTSALYLPHDFGQVTTPPWASVSSSVKSPLLQGFQKNKVI